MFINICVINIEIKRKCTVNITKTTNLPELKLKKLDIMKNSTNGFVPKAASEICKPTTRIAYSRKQVSVILYITF